MKKLICTLISALLCVCLLVGCGQTGGETVRQISSERIPLADSPSALQEVSDLIVVFTPEDHTFVMLCYSDDNVSTGYTKTVGTVSEVLKGDLAAGDAITITEECYTTDEGSDLWTQGGYLLMQQGESYLLFLTAYEDSSDYAGMYFPTDLEYGKYALPQDGGMPENPTMEDLELGSGEELETYVTWYHEVERLYPDLF